MTANSPLIATLLVGISVGHLSGLAHEVFQVLEVAQKRKTTKVRQVGYWKD